MENKEQLEQFVAYIKRLEKLTEDIREREIYPVAFFSEAFDVTNRMQALLHRMEVSELALFERQMKVHEAQIRSTGHLSEYVASPSDTPSREPQPQEVPPPSAPPATEKPVAPSLLPLTPRRDTPPPIPPPPPPKRTTEKPDGWLNETIEKNRLADLRKAFTLNDRFRFCRDLFGKDENLMNRTIAELNVKTSYEASVTYLQEQFNWNFEDETVAEFVAVLEKRFS